LDIPEYSNRFSIFLLKFWFFEISTFLQIVEIVLKLPRYYDTFIDERASPPVQLALAGKGATQLCTSKKEYIKYDLTVAQYF
jgi:hypothetical protein